MCRGPRTTATQCYYARLHNAGRRYCFNYRACVRRVGTFERSSVRARPHLLVHTAVARRLGDRPCPPRADAARRTRDPYRRSPPSNRVPTVRRVVWTDDGGDDFVLRCNRYDRRRPLDYAHCPTKGDVSTLLRPAQVSRHELF